MQDRLRAHGGRLRCGVKAIIILLKARRCALDNLALEVYLARIITLQEMDGEKEGEIK